MIVIGVDPGVTGAISFLTIETKKIAVHSFPTRPRPDGRNELDLKKLVRLIHGYILQDIRLAVIELVGAGSFAGRKAGSVSSFTFGKSYGEVLGILTALGIDIVKVRPAVWKHLMKLNSDKDLSRLRAREAFPSIADQFKSKNSDGKAESALLAMFGAMRFQRFI